MTIVCRRRKGSFDNRASQHLQSARPVSGEIFVFGRCEVRVEQRQVVLDGRIQPLEPLPFDLLVHLIRHRHEVVSKERLLDRVWRNRCLSDGVISVAVQKARLAIGDCSKRPALIATVPRRGYRFVGEPVNAMPRLLPDWLQLASSQPDAQCVGWLESLAHSDAGAALTLATQMLERAHAGGHTRMEAAMHRVLGGLHLREGASCLARLHFNEGERLLAREAAPWGVRHGGHFLHQALDQSPDPVFIKDQAHRWVFLNRAFCRFIGHAREDLLGKSDYDFFPPAQADIFWQQDDVVLRSRQESTNEEVITPSRGATYIATTTKAMLVDDSQESFLIGTLRFRPLV